MGDFNFVLNFHTPTPPPPLIYTTGRNFGILVDYTFPMSEIPPLEYRENTVSIQSVANQHFQMYVCIADRHVIGCAAFSNAAKL